MWPSPKADYDAEILEIENKCFATSDYNKSMSNTLDAKIKQKKLVNKYGFSEMIKTLTT